MSPGKGTSLASASPQSLAEQIKPRASKEDKETQQKKKVAALVSSVRLFQFLEEAALKELSTLLTPKTVKRGLKELGSHQLFTSYD